MQLASLPLPDHVVRMESGGRMEAAACVSWIFLWQVMRWPVSKLP